MQRNTKHFYLGLLFVLIGAVWALDNIDLLPRQIGRYFFQWENILIVMGAFLLLTRENVRVGIALLALGLFFVLDDWFTIDISIWEIWPLGLVFIGIYLIGRKTSSSSDEEIVLAEEVNTVEDMAIFSGGDKIISTLNFSGGTLTAMFGGSNIDLTTSSIGDKPAVLDVFFMFGGSKVRVPQDWQVDFQVTSLFGGMADKRKFIDQQESKKKLIIKGLIIFGGSEITN